MEISSWLDPPTPVDQSFLVNNSSISIMGFPLLGILPPVRHRNNGKKAKFVRGSGSRAVCQLKDCGADLSNAKDYHRRHEVCERHSKASGAIVGNIMQRFCQQCSQFHTLQEFHEGKRSCGRRLAGHYKGGRRQILMHLLMQVHLMMTKLAVSYLLVSLLKILSNMHATQSKQTEDQDLLTHILRSLDTSQIGGKNITGLLQESQDIAKGGTSLSKWEAIPPVVRKAFKDPQGICSCHHHNLLLGVSMV
ncbi:hypothetical protein SAY87_030766 [Trapa incisa]|uniref:SBP-type domain-containing protein n=1 Tax=Trapa incisa TaxID=236973 RepID=A0AAN7KSA2_9MYRT|nr:hypothetical protein SAY87_030766 [Trapa incisa]